MKLMVCFWLDVNAAFHSEMLGCNQSINYQLFYQQLQLLTAAIAQKRPKLINIAFFHDNARLQVV